MSKTESEVTEIVDDPMLRLADLPGLTQRWK